VQRSTTADDATTEALRARIAELESALATEREHAEMERARADAAIARANALTMERDRLRAAYRRLQIDLELLRRRIFVAKAERVDTRQLELEFQAKKAELDALAERLDEEKDGQSDDEGEKPKSKSKARKKPKGRRDLSGVPIKEERCEILDKDLEQDTSAQRIGFEESYQLGWQKGGPIKIVIARAKYQVKTGAEGDTTVVTAAMPARTFARCLAAPSLLAKILVDKFGDGLPLFRQEERFLREGLKLDRGTMCRWVEDCGMTAGCVALAMREEALKTAFCIATDATGVAVQPEPTDGRGRSACRRGHFFVMLADRDHVLFEYTPRETSAKVADLFRGFSGYVQADAKSVYDVLFRAAGETPIDVSEETEEVRSEVGCWAHARRKFFEAAAAKDKIAREALYRLHRLFEIERELSDLPPSKRKELRNTRARPLLDDFFDWATEHYAVVKAQRGLLRTAFGYVVRQREALSRFLDDGRLKIDNNASERELRRIAVGRKAWLFVGSDDHAEAAANLFSLIASCKLHRLDAEAYLRDLFRVLAHWPRDRYLELAPRYWARTRARLDERQLELPVGDLTIPPPPEEQSSPR
jgi:transposase